MYFIIFYIFEVLFVVNIYLFCSVRAFAHVKKLHYGRRNH